jgi:hypothetical protein
MSTSRCILLDHAHIGDQHIPFFVDLIGLVLQDYEHVTLHITRSCPHWRSTHPFLHWFDCLSTTRLWACHVAYSSIMPTLEINTTLPSLIQFFILKDYEHITLHTPRSCPHWRSTHPFLRLFDSLSTTRLWARHIAYSSIMPTLDTTYPFHYGGDWNRVCWEGGNKKDI